MKRKTIKINILLSEVSLSDIQGEMFQKFKQTK